MSARTRTIDISEIDATLSSLANEITQAKTRVLIQESGTPVAALVSLDDVRRLEQLDREWEEGTKALERFSQAFADVPGEELEARIAEIIAEGRGNYGAEVQGHDGRFVSYR